MPYCSGAVATVSAVTYKMPVPSSSSRFTTPSYRTTSTSRDRSWRDYSSSSSSSSSSFVPRSTSYTSDYKSKYSSRTSSVPTYSRTGSLTEPSTSRYTTPASSRERSEARDSGVGYSASTASSRSRDSSKARSEATPASTSATTTTSSSSTSSSAPVERRYSNVASSMADFYSKYSPSNYVSGSTDIGRPPLRSTTSSYHDVTAATTTEKAASAVGSTSPSSSYVRSRNLAASPEKSTLLSSRLASRSPGGAVGGCSPSLSTERRSRLAAGSGSEVILHLNNTNNNNGVNNNSASSSDEEDDDNGNRRRPSFAEIRSRFDSGAGASTSSPEVPDDAAGGGESGGRVRRRLQFSCSSPVITRKVYAVPGDAASSGDEDAARKKPVAADEDDDEEESEEDDEEEETPAANHVAESDAASTPGGSGVAGGASSPAAATRRYRNNLTPLVASPNKATGAGKAQQCSTSSSDSDTSVISSLSPRISAVGRTSSSTENGGLIGLRNIGNTCFMNSVIQCLSNTRPLLEYLLTDTYLSDLNTSVSSMKGALIKAFSSVIQELWRGDSSERVVNTTSFKSQVQRFAPRFMGYSQQDAQEFLRYLLEGLHEDVNRVTGKPRPILTEIEDTLSDQQKATESWKRYLRMDDSKVVDIFVGQLKSTLRCTSCGHCSVTFDPFWDLSLPIPTRTGQLRLQQCFDHFTKEEVLDGDEKPTCAKCQMRRKCTKSFTIQKFPKILVLHLKRFSPTERFRGKLSVTVDFPLNGLDLSAYAANKGQGCMYKLYGVANHSGTTYSGHYTAYCKHPYTTEWHEYNDSRVSTISTRSIVSGEAYVLFYELSGHSSHL